VGKTQLKLTWSFAAINRTSRCVTPSVENMGFFAGATRASSRLTEGNTVVQPRSLASLMYSSLWNLSRWPRRPVFEVEVEYVYVREGGHSAGSSRASKAALKRQGSSQNSGSMRRDTYLQETQYLDDFPVLLVKKWVISRAADLGAWLSIESPERSESVRLVGSLEAGGLDKNHHQQLPTTK
jgi:hypothetical protein